MSINTVQSVVDDRKCTGCSSCANICPVEAITMVENREGFWVPSIDTESCINCGVCRKKCVAINPKYKNDWRPKCYAVMADDNLRMISSSGGFFSIAAEWILEKGGYVCGASFDKDFRVKHIIIHDLEKLNLLRGSKYMQSNIGYIYKNIKDLLEKDEYVLFTGTPCQVAGLHSFLSHDYKKLYTIDLFCHGITSSKVFEKYYKDVHGQKELMSLKFKAKEPWGWHAGINAEFRDGTHYSKPLETDPFFIAYLSSISENVTCGNCKVNRLPRQGDLSMGDFWGISKFDKKLDDKKGTSAVLVNNEKGNNLIEEVKNKMFICEEVPLEVAINGNKVITDSYPIHKNRDSFFDMFEETAFVDAVNTAKSNNVWNGKHIELQKKISKDLFAHYFLAKIVAENVQGRKIVTWVKSELFEKVLKEHFGLTVEFYISKKIESVNNKSIRSFYDMKGLNSEYYLVSLDAPYSEEDYNLLKEYGYEEIKDFVFRMHKPIVIKNFNCSKETYSDLYGNTVEGSGFIGKLVFRGLNNHVKIGNSNIGGKNLDFSFGSNTFVEIGNSCNFKEINKFEHNEYIGCAEIKIGDRCRFANSKFRLFNHLDTSLRINNNCTFENNLEMHICQGKKIIIGNDCMFSYNISLWAGDGHSIFDVKTAKNINSVPGNFNPAKGKIVIGDHVWIGYGAEILHGTNIGDGSIVGAKSVVKGKFPNNCTISGNPSALVKNDTAWSRESFAVNIKSCGDYAKLTSYSEPSITAQKVLVIGGTRFMGIELVHELLKLGNEVTIATRGNTKDNFGINVQRIVLDISDAESVKNTLKNMYFDVVFDNLAYCSNYVRNILSNVKCSRYVQLSSIAAYFFREANMKESSIKPEIGKFQWCDESVGYGLGKLYAEKAVYRYFPDISSVTVRIPYVTKTDRLYYYARCISKGIPMKIEDSSRGLTFVRATEVGKFLPWIAAQRFTGAINLSSEGMITIQMIIEYIEKKVGKRAILDSENGLPSPFNEKTFSLDMTKAKKLGYKTSEINDWFWELMDEYISRAILEKE